MSSSSLWWPMCSTSVLSRLRFRPCLVNNPFHSNSISCSSCLSFATRARSSAQKSFFVASFITVFLLMRSNTAMNSRRFRTLPCLSPISTSKTPPMLLLPSPLLLLSSRACPQPCSLPLLVLHPP